MADISRIARYSLEMDAPLSTQPIVGILQRTDKKADTIQVDLKQGGQAVSLTGATAAAYFKRPVDGAQVRCAGTVNGGAITVQLADQCYKNAGPFELLLKLVSGGVERTILRLTGYVEAGGDGAIVDPTGSIPSYDELEAAVAAATAAAETANTAAENADAKAQAAETAAGSASSAAQAANTAAGAANTAAGKIDGLTVAASGLAAGAAPTAAVSEVDGHKHIAFGIPKGEKGDMGATPNIQIGTVSTGSPGTDAAASMGGTAENPMLNLTIPRGADGSGSVSTVDGVEPSGGDVPLGAVRYNAAQSLDGDQKGQARQNIDVYSTYEVFVNYVASTFQQSLSEEHKAQARENIEAAKNAAMTGATSSAAGAAGLVPAPGAGDEGKVLRGDGTWGAVDSSGSVRYDAAQALTDAQKAQARTNMEAAAKTAERSASLTAAGWTGDAAPYTQAVSLEGVAATAHLIIGLAPTATAAQVAAAAAAQLLATAQAAGSVTISAFGEKPTEALPILIMEVG